MPRIIQDGHVGADKVRADSVFEVLGGGFFYVVEKQDVEIQLGQRGRNQFCVVFRVRQRSKLVFAVSNNNSSASRSV